jgi:hypothetical protein
VTRDPPTTRSGERSGNNFRFEDRIKPRGRCRRRDLFIPPSEQSAWAAALCEVDMARLLGVRLWHILAATPLPTHTTGYGFSRLHRAQV